MSAAVPALLSLTYCGLLVRHSDIPFQLVSNSKDDLPALVRAFARENFMCSACLGEGQNSSNRCGQFLRVEHLNQQPDGSPVL